MQHGKAGRWWAGWWIGVLVLGTACGGTRVQPPPRDVTAGDPGAGAGRPVEVSGGAASAAGGDPAGAVSGPAVGGEAASGSGGATEPGGAHSGGEGAGSAAADPTARMEEDFFVAEGAPAPRGCTADADCLGDTVPAPGGCCNDPLRIRAHAWSYRTWLTRWRADHCGGVTCPPPPAPSRPDDCYFDVYCSPEGRCENRCRS